MTVYDPETIRKRGLVYLPIISIGGSTTQKCTKCHLVSKGYPWSHTCRCGAAMEHPTGCHIVWVWCVECCRKYVYEVTSELRMDQSQEYEKQALLAAEAAGWDVHREWPWFEGQTVRVACCPDCQRA